MSEILTDEARAAIRQRVEALDGPWTPHGDIAALLAEGDALREQVARLTRERTMYHRRAQQAEAALVQAADVGGPSIGRAAANAGYRHWKDRAYAAERERDTERAAHEALIEAANHAVMEWRLHGQLTDSCRHLEAAIAALRRQETPR